MLSAQNKVYILKNYRLNGPDSIVNVVYELEVYEN
jgi:hypothetical protein